MSANAAKKTKAAEALALGNSNQEAADRAGVHVRTVQRWLKDAEFQRRVTRMQDERFAQLARRFISATGLALRVAVETLQDPQARRSEKMRAAEYVTKYATTFKEQLDIAERVAALEERLTNGKR